MTLQPERVSLVIYVQLAIELSEFEIGRFFGLSVKDQRELPASKVDQVTAAYP